MSIPLCRAQSPAPTTNPTGAFPEPRPCKELRHVSLPASAIGMPTTGVDVTSASHHGGKQPYCRVMGRIHPVDPAADDIRFELNLPDRWNGKAAQFGGGTFDGYLAATSGRGDGPVGFGSPLARGYATFGSDGGHHTNYFPLPDAINALNAKFARNLEMRKNFAGDAVKKTHDAVVALMQQHYGRRPSRMYFVGGSTGGREALHAAQRFPDDYDGVLAAYAAWDQLELDFEFIRNSKALYAKGGFLGFAQTHLITRTVEQQCDAADGLRDRIISDPASCHIDPTILRCADGKAHHGCLSDPQMHTLEAFAAPQRTSFPVDHNVDSIPGYNVLSGAELTDAIGLLHFPLHHPILGFNYFGYVIGDDVLRNFSSAGHHYDALNFDPVGGGNLRQDALANARILDATDPDLRPFLAHGGKLLLVHGTADAVIPTNSTVDYYQRLQAKLGPKLTASFARLYLVPGLAHGYGRFYAGFDTVDTLDAWADRGIAPVDLVVRDRHHGHRTRPLCEFPTWPKYNGTGDPDVASSFRCVVTPAPVSTLASVTRP